jgi:transcriptional antiterminator NusG
VKIKAGPFEGFDGTVDELLEATGHVRVVLSVFGRATVIDLEYVELERSD